MCRFFLKKRPVSMANACFFPPVGTSCYAPIPLDPHGSILHALINELTVSRLSRCWFVDVGNSQCHKRHKRTIPQKNHPFL